HFNVHDLEDALRIEQAVARLWGEVDQYVVLNAKRFGMAHDQTFAGEKLDDERTERQPPCKGTHGAADILGRHDTVSRRTSRISRTSLQAKSTNRSSSVRSPAAPPPNARVDFGIKISVPSFNSTMNGSKGSRWTSRRNVLSKSSASMRLAYRDCSVH